MAQQRSDPQAVSPAALADLLSSQQKVQAQLLEDERARGRARLRHAVEEAKLDTAQVMRGRAEEAHAQGLYAPCLLVNDPYRDTRATLAEARTNSLALKLSVDGVEFTYDVDGWVKGRYSRRRLSRHFDDLAEAQDFFDAVCGRFFRISDFRTLVDF